MHFRKALSGGREHIFSAGYIEWSKNRSYEKYCADNAREDAFGTRFVIELGGEIVSSLILLRLKDVAGKKAYGIGSVLTPKPHAGRGYATQLIRECIRQEIREDSYLFLFSDISPDFYKKFDFRILPAEFQKYEKSVLMVHCSDGGFDTLLNCLPEDMPNYF